jgi:hypothetical protein
METTTQVTQPGASSPQVQPTTEAAGGTPGVEARIAELTAKSREFESRLIESQNREAMLLGTLAEQAARGVQSVVTQPAVQVEPEEAQRIRAVLAPELQRLEKLTAQLAQRSGATELQIQLQHEDPKVAQRATQLMSDWQRAGLNGWQPKDAIVYARGEIYSNPAALRAAAAEAERQRFNAGNPVVAGSNGMPVLQQTEAIPADIGKWALDKQAEFWEKRAEGKSF